jgi:hypothetical protein
VAFWYIPHRFGILCQEKSGNPAADTSFAGFLCLHSGGPDELVKKSPKTLPNHFFLINALSKL